MSYKINTCYQNGIIIKGMKKLENGSFDFGMIWTKNGELKLITHPKVKATGQNCGLGQWVQVKENLRRGRADHIIKLNANEIPGKIDENGDFVVPYPVRLGQYIESEVPGTRFYRNEFFQWIKIEQEFYDTNENQQIVVYLKKLAESIPIPGEANTKCYWEVKEFHTIRPEDLNQEKPVGFVPDSTLPNIEDKFAHFRVDDSNGLPQNWLEQKKKKTSKAPRLYRNPFAPVKIYWHPPNPSASNSRAPSTSSYRPDASLTPPETPTDQDTRNAQSSALQESYINLPTSKAMVTTKTASHLIIFLFKINKPAILNLESYRGGSVPDMKDEFNCRYKKIVETMGLEYEVVGVTSYIESFLHFKTEGMENLLFLPINLHSQEDRFEKLNVVNSTGISDYVVIGEEVKDQNTELMPTSALLRKYRGDFSAREMVGSCSLKRMEVPKMMVDKKWKEEKEMTIAWVWKLERVVSYLDEFPGYQNPRETASA